jgi:hypothetical protein
MQGQTAPRAQAGFGTIKKRMGQIARDPLLTRDMWCSILNLVLLGAAFTLLLTFQLIQAFSKDTQNAVEARDDEKSGAFQGYTTWVVANWFGFGLTAFSLGVLVVGYLWMLRPSYEKYRRIADRERIARVKTLITVIAVVHGLVFAFMFIIAFKAFWELGATYGRDAIDPSTACSVDRAYDYHVGYGTGALLACLSNLLISIWFFMNGSTMRQFFYSKTFGGIPVRVDYDRPAAAQMGPSAGYYSQNPNYEHNF